jgi:hypothetical protein
MPKGAKKSVRLAALGGFEPLSCRVNLATLVSDCFTPPGHRWESPLRPGDDFENLCNYIDHVINF